MFIEIINKVLILLFFLSTLNTIRHCYFFIQSWITKTRYILKLKGLLILGLSISFILMSIFDGLTL